MKKIKPPGFATQILLQPFDARKYIESAIAHVTTSPETALRVANAVIAQNKNSKEGWLLLFLASMTLWSRLGGVTKFFRNATSYRSLPKAIKLVSWMSDHVGIPRVWLKLLESEFQGDEVMTELILTFVSRIDPTPTNKVELAKVLTSKAKVTTIEKERDIIYAHALRLVDEALAADPNNGTFVKVQRDILATAAAAGWQDVAVSNGNYLDLIAKELHPRAQ